MGLLEQTWLPEPELGEVEIETILQALADPVRLQIVRLLRQGGESACGSLALPVKRSTASHHMRVLRESGVVETRLEGNSRISKLRWDELDQRFPGLLASVLDAAPAQKNEKEAAQGE